MSVIEDNWDYNIDLYHFDNKSYSELEATVCSWMELILHQLEDGFKLQKYVYNAKGSGKVALNHDDELKDLVEKNKILRNDIESKLEELTQITHQYENYKKGKLSKWIMFVFYGKLVYKTTVYYLRSMRTGPWAYTSSFSSSLSLESILFLGSSCSCQ